MIDFSKPVQTICGYPVRIICTDKKGTAYPVVGWVIFDGEGEEELASWTVEGTYVINQKGRNDYNLINVPA